jgi:hypothetical protein
MYFVLYFERYCSFAESNFLNVFEKPEKRHSNFLGACGSKSKSFVVSASRNVPMVLLNARNQISVFTNSTLSISEDVKLIELKAVSPQDPLNSSDQQNEDAVKFSSQPSW